MAIVFDFFDLLTFNKINNTLFATRIQIESFVKHFFFIDSSCILVSFKIIYF